MMARRTLFLGAGGYDDSLRYGADCDVMTRLLGRTRFANIAEHLYVYRRRPGQKTKHDNPKVDHDLLLVRHRRLRTNIGAEGVPGFTGQAVPNQNLVPLDLARAPGGQARHPASD